jgi:chromate reductase, NAD(P)H dehydrogenase (quinone)
MAKFLMFSGSTRKASFNKKLVKETSKIAKKLGAEVTVIDLQDYPMPIYNGDIEENSGYPDSSKKLYELIKEHDALVISSPEYNGFPSPLLKNVIDWVSRIDVKVYDGKAAAIISISSGGLGGMRGLLHLRILLNNLNMLVMPGQVSIGNAFEVFNNDGALKNDTHQDMLKSLMSRLLSVLDK